MGTQFGLKIDFKSYPNTAIKTMWPHKLPEGLHRRLQDPKNVPKGTHKAPNKFQNGIKQITQGNVLCYFVEGVGGMSEATKFAAPLQRLQGVLNTDKKPNARAWRLASPPPLASDMPPTPALRRQNGLKKNTQKIDLRKVTKSVQQGLQKGPRISSTSHKIRTLLANWDLHFLLYFT